MYVVRSGTVDVITFGTVLETVGAGGMFGEIGLIDGGVRSAAALASEATAVAVIDRQTFDALVPVSYTLLTLPTHFHVAPS